MYDNYKSIIVEKNNTIVKVMETINKIGSRIALVIDDKERLIGIATDGDIRRSFLKGHSPNEPVSNIMNSTPLMIKEGMDRSEMISLLSDYYKEIPVINNEKEIVGLLTLEDRELLLDIKSRKVCVLGLGYVGLPLSLILADKGFKVFGYDIDQIRLDQLKEGVVPFHEPGLDAFLHRHLQNQFSLSNDLNSVDADIYIITVGTPVDEKSKVPIIDYIVQVADSIGSVIKKNDLIILRSTVTVGTSRNIVLKRLEKVSGLRAGKDFSLAYAPERTIEGNAINEIQELPQIIGGLDNKSTLLVDQFFRKITSTIVDVGSLEGAEMVKILNNTFRDTKFAYANEMAMICKELNLDAVKLIRAANMDYKRDAIPVPSPGVGGACLTKDSYILIEACKDIDISPDLVRCARTINELIPRKIVDDIMKELKSLNKNYDSINIFIIGFAFKGTPETSDTRGSTTIDILDSFRTYGIQDDSFYGYDPVVLDDDMSSLGVKPVSLDEGFKDADVVLIMNNHKSYKNMDIFSLLRSAKNDCVIMDGWYTFDPKDLVTINNIKYIGVGCRI